MWPRRYFTGKYFAPRYWPGESTTPTTTGEGAVIQAPMRSSVIEAATRSVVIEQPTRSSVIGR